MAIYGRVLRTKVGFLFRLVVLRVYCTCILLVRLGHVEGMAEDNNVQKNKGWNPMSKTPIGRPKTRWEDDVLEDIRSMNVRNWKKVAQNRDRWKKVVEQARTLYRL